MSDLTKRLRSGDASWELREKAADALEAKDKRIAELETQHKNFLHEFWETNAENERLRNSEATLKRRASESNKRIAELEAAIADTNVVVQQVSADNERLRAALESIANNTCCDNCQEAALVAHDALAAFDNTRSKYKNALEELNKTNHEEEDNEPT